MDTAALQTLGITPELGAEVTGSYSVTDTAQTAFPVTDPFTLVGFWDYDDLMPVHYINIPADYATSIEAQAAEQGLEPFRVDLNVMMASAANIRGQMEQVDSDLGYTWDSYGDPNSVRIGVNWGYTTSQMASQLNPQTVIAIAAFLLLVIFTGYLIIYNIFQISVTGDIRFYGLLKTIGTTPRQLTRIIRQQALLLCVIGIPAGIQSSMFSASNVVIQSAVNSFGAVAVSGNAAVANLEGFAYVIENSFHQTAVNYVGQNSAAGQFDRVKKISGLCILYAVIAGIITGVGMNLFSGQLLGLYITDSGEAIAIGVTRMVITVLPYFLFGMQDVVTGILRGLGASFLSMIITVLGICGIRILWIYTIFRIPAYHTQQCLYISYPLSWVLTFIVQMIAFVVVFRKCERQAKMTVEEA